MIGEVELPAFCCSRDGNGEPAVLIHHGIVRRWRCGSLVTQRPLSLSLSMTYQLLLSMTYHFQSRLGKTDCTDIWVIKLKNQVSPSIRFRVPHLAGNRLKRKTLNATMTEQ